MTCAPVDWLHEVPDLIQDALKHIADRVRIENVACWPRPVRCASASLFRVGN